MRYHKRFCLLYRYAISYCDIGYDIVCDIDVRYRCTISYATLYAISHNRNAYRDIVCYIISQYRVRYLNAISHAISYVLSLCDIAIRYFIATSGTISYAISLCNFTIQDLTFTCTTETLGNHAEWQIMQIAIIQNGRMAEWSHP